MDTSRNLWVYIEIDESGQPKNVGLELLKPGRELAKKQGGKLCAVIIGGQTETVAKTVALYGVDEVILVEGEEYARYSTDAYSHAFCSLVTKYAPASILIGATDQGRDLAPRIACRLKTGLTADCTELDFDEESGNIAWTRPAFGGNLMARILCPNHRPQMGTVRPGVFTKELANINNQPDIMKESIRFPQECIRTTFLEEFLDADSNTINLEEADIIVAGGRGIGGIEGFSILQELADALGGMVGASRIAVDSGWISSVHQVGQTGKTVRPKVYIACGISGAIQHLAAMNASDTIIAINTDPEAPMVKAADYAIIGDLFEIVPELTKMIKQHNYKL